MNDEPETTLCEVSGITNQICGKLKYGKAPATVNFVCIVFL
jgi:hypothetical protein